MHVKYAACVRCGVTPRYMFPVPTASHLDANVNLQNLGNDEPGLQEMPDLLC